MDISYLETAMAFVGLASIVAGSFAHRLTGHVLSAQRARRSNAREANQNSR
jgi:hypothetical protein